MTKSTFVTALKWSTASELGSKAVQPIIFLILAGILTPEEYGVMAVAIMVISFTQVFWEAGMGKALIQCQENIEQAANAAFWINLGLALIFALVLFFSSDLIATHLFHDNRVSDVVKVMTLQIVFGSLASVQTALLQKEMKFNKLFWVRIASAIIPGAFSIPLALYGMSYWAIVAGILVGQAFQVIALWYSSSWRPAFNFSVPVAKEIMHFGFWVSLTGLLVWFYLWADSFVVGAFLGTHDLGLFRTANTFVLLLFDVLFAPLLPVLYSYFSSKSTAKIYYASSTIIRVIAVIAIPLGFLLFTLAIPISDSFFGEKWAGIGFIIGLLGIMRGYSWLVGINGEIYRAVGKPQYETVIYAFSSVFFLAGYLVSIQIGFKEFIYTRLILGMLSLIPHFYLFKKVLKNSLRPILRTVILSSFAGLIPIGVNLIMPHINNGMLYIIVVSIVSVVLMGMFIFFFEHKLVSTFLFELRKNSGSMKQFQNE